MSTIWYHSLFQGKSENEIPGMSELECCYIIAVRAAVFFSHLYRDLISES